MARKAAAKFVLGLEDLQHAAAAVIIGDPGLLAQFHQAGLAVMRDALSRRLVDRETFAGAVGDKGGQPRAIAEGRGVDAASAVHAARTASARPRAACPARPTGRRSPGQTRRHCRSWFPAPAPIAGRPPSLRGRLWTDSRRRRLPITPAPRTITFMASPGIFRDRHREPDPHDAIRLSLPSFGFDVGVLDDLLVLRHLVRDVFGEIVRRGADRFEAEHLEPFT